MTLYTFGYTGSTPTDLKAFADALGALVVDVRLRPWSWVPHWRRDALGELLNPHVPQAGVRQDSTDYGYTWMGDALGNVNYRNGGPILLKAPERAVTPLRWQLERRPVILICGCAHHIGCHRTEAADYLAQAIGGQPVIEHLPQRFAEWQEGRS